MSTEWTPSAEDLARIADENEARTAALWPDDYDPRWGIGCYGDRVPLRIDENEAALVPERMMGLQVVQTIQEAGSLARVQRYLGLSEEAHRTFVMHYRRERCACDPEYWFSMCVSIRTKREGYAPFILRPVQRKFLAHLLDQYWAGTEVRTILLKARQWGGSTLTQMFLAWVQLWRRMQWNIAIVADVQSQALHIRGMYNVMRQMHPISVMEFEFVPYEGQTSVRRIPSREALLGVGSVKNPDAMRSYTYHLLHLSEVGLWQSTAQQNAEDLMTGLEGALVDGPGTVCVKESTAKGAGTYFHRDWQEAQQGTSGYRPFFVAWHEIEDYTRPVSEADLGPFVRSWNAYERELWDQGATIEGICWYRHRLERMPSFGREWRMKQEFPTTPAEAFQSSGRRVFAPSYVTQARATCRPPAVRGELTAASRKGERALDEISLMEQDTGALKIWRKPGDTYGGLLDLIQYRVSGRYCGFMDIGGRAPGTDYHVLTIIDRAPMLPVLGSPPEVVAQWRAHLDQDLAAWYAAQICAWYENALFAIEKNSLRRKAGDGVEPDSTHSYTVLDQIKQHYRNLYFEEKHDEEAGERWRAYGFHTNVKTKPMIVDTLNAALRDRGYIERSTQACDEFDFFVVHESARLGAQDGQHDDIVISRAGAVWLALQHMDAPRLIERSSGERKRRPVTTATIA